MQQCDHAVRLAPHPLAQRGVVDEGAELDEHRRTSLECASPLRRDAERAVVRRERIHALAVPIVEVAVGDREQVVLAVESGLVEQRERHPVVLAPSE